MNFKEKDKLLMDLEEKSYAEDFDEKDLSILNKLSYDKDAYIRSVVAEALVVSEDEKAEQILLRLTKDKTWLVRADACDSLCISKSVETYNLLESMAKKDTSGCVRGYAVLSLGEIANRIHRKSELTKFLEERLEKEKSQFAQINIYTILYKMGQQKYLKNILAMLDTNNHCNRSAAVECLEEIVDDSNKEVIIASLSEHKKVETARSVICTIDEKLEEIFLNDLEEKADEEGFNEQEFSKLKEIAGGERCNNRGIAARILVNADLKEAEEILQHLVHDEDLFVRMEACDSLRIGKTLKTYKLLKNTVEKDKSNLVRGYAISSLGYVAVEINQKKELIEFLEKILLTEKVEFTKIFIFTVLYDLGKEEYLTDLLAFINSKRYQNREIVIENLYRIVNDRNKDVILKALMEQKNIETIDSVISEINELIEDIESGHCE